VFQFKWVLGVAAVLFTALSAGRAADDDETYDLRGPAPEKGQVYVSKETFTIKEADTTIKMGDQTVTMKMTFAATSEEEAKVLAIKDREVTKCQTKVIKDRADITVSNGGKDVTQTEPNPLEEETIISERDGAAWKHVLVDTKPSEKQKKELDTRNGIENDDDLYPKEKVKVGHKWTVDAAALAKLLGNPFTNVKGKVHQAFVKVEELDGEKVAVIESDAKLTAKMKDEGEPTMNVEMELKITTWKSLKTGLSVKDSYTGKIKLSGTVKVDDEKNEMTMSGPLSGESTTKLK
jgi:hypothetical protein